MIVDREEPGFVAYFSLQPYTLYAPLNMLELRVAAHSMSFTSLEKNKGNDEKTKDFLGHSFQINARISGLPLDDLCKPSSNKQNMFLSYAGFSAKGQFGLATYRHSRCWRLLAISRLSSPPQDEYSTLRTGHSTDA